MGMYFEDVHHVSSLSIGHVGNDPRHTSLFPEDFAIWYEALPTSFLSVTREVTGDTVPLYVTYIELWRALLLTIQQSEAVLPFY